MVEVEAGPGDGSGASGVPGRGRRTPRSRLGPTGKVAGVAWRWQRSKTGRPGVEQRDAEMPEDAEKKEGEREKSERLFSSLG